MIARMSERAKNHQAFLRVAARLTPRYPDAEFVLVGDGPLRSELEVYARACGLGDRLRFLGDRDNMPAVLSALDITVLPSSSESLSNVILESMAAGVPVVATNVGGNPELIQDGQTGFLVPLTDDAFVHALETLLRNPDRRTQCGERARVYAKSHHRLPIIREQHEQLYESLLEAKGWQLQTKPARAAA
jgi:glycosyltransferase involved in cell wall biosynthesis